MLVLTRLEFSLLQDFHWVWGCQEAENLIGWPHSHGNLSKNSTGNHITTFGWSVPSLWAWGVSFSLSHPWLPVVWNHGKTEINQSINQSVSCSVRDWSLPWFSPSTLKKGKGATFLPCWQCGLVTKPHKLKGWFWSKKITGYSTLEEIFKFIQSHHHPAAPASAQEPHPDSSWVIAELQTSLGSSSQGLTSLSKEKKPF